MAWALLAVMAGATPSATTIRPTSLAATGVSPIIERPTLWRRHGDENDAPASCGYDYPRLYTCEGAGLRTAPGRATFSNDTRSISLATNELTAFEHATIANLDALTVLRLDQNELTAIDAATFSGLVGLSQLILSSNKLSAIDPNTFTGLVGLTSLHLSSNSIEEIEPTTFSDDLVALNILLLRSNKLTVIEPAAFAWLTALIVLDLGLNQLTMIHPTTFAALSTLISLDLSSNALTAIEPTTFEGLAALNVLHLESNQLATIEPTTFQGLSALTVLNLGSNQLTAIEPSTFSEPTALLKLYLNSNQLAAIDPSTFSRLSALTVLSLGSNQLTAIEPSTLSELTALLNLYLDSNQLAAIDPRTFSGGLGLVALTVLYLNSNQLTAIDPRTFSVLTALTVLYLNSNQLTAIDPSAFSGLGALNALSLNFNQLTAIEPTTFGETTALVQLYLNSNQLAAIDPTTFSGLAAVKQLKLNSNQLTAIDPSIFFGLAALTELHLGSNQLTAIDAATFAGLATTLTELDLNSNALTMLKNGTFAALLNLEYLNLAANRIQALDDGVFDFAAVYERLNGSEFDQVPRFLYNPNPLQCGDSSVMATTGGGGAGRIRCTLCTQGYVENNASTDPLHRRQHVTCVRPDFKLDVVAGTRTLDALRNGLNGRIAYVGEKLDVYAQAIAEDSSFEPKRDKFRGFAPDENSFSSIRFEAKVGDIDIGCGAVVVGSLHDPRSVDSRTHQVYQPGGTEEHHDLDPIPLCTGRQRLLRFQVLDDGVFDFISCGSRFPASLGVYDASCNGTDGSLVDCIVAPYTVGQDSEFNQIGHDAPNAPPLHIPDRYSCPLGPSANLSNVYLSAGRYLLGVQPLPLDPTPDSPKDVFEVEMRCRNTATAAPLDPTDGGVTVNPVTGQLTVSPGKNATPGNYNLSLTAVDAARARTTLLHQELPIRRRSRLALTVASCGGEVHGASTTNIRNKNSENGPFRRHDLGSVVVFPAFLSGTGVDDRCSARSTFKHFATDSGGDPLIRYDVAITTAAGTSTDLGQDTFVNGRTGKLEFTLEPHLGSGNYSISLRAFTGDEGPPLTLQSWVMDVRHRDTETATNGPNGRGCGVHGTPEDTHPQDDAYTCRCDPLFRGENCEAWDAPAIILGGALGLVALVLLAGLTRSFRARSFLTRSWTTLSNSLTDQMLNPDELELEPMIAATTFNDAFDGDAFGSGAVVAATNALPADVGPGQDDLAQSLQFRRGLVE